MLDNLIEIEEFGHQDSIQDNDHKGNIVLHERFHVKLDKKIPHLSLHAHAYEIEDSQEQYDHLYALVLNPKMLPRVDMLETLFRRSIKDVQPVFGWSINFYPEYHSRVPIVLLEKPSQPSLRELLNNNQETMSTAYILEHFIAPIEIVLSALNDINLIYRSFSLDNIFWDGTADNSPVLGQSFATVAGAMQPVALENLSRMLCSPLLRGNGSTTEDVFALGALTCQILQYNNANSPFQLSDQDIIDQRLLYGTFHTYTRGLHLDVKMNEFLRGTLYDIYTEQWTLKDTQQWIDGLVKSLKNPFIPKKARRPMLINDKQCFTLREVAYQASKNWETWEQLYESAPLEGWLRNEIGDNHDIDRYSGIRLKYEYIKNKDIRLCLGLFSLSPNNPLMFRGHIFMVDAIMNFVRLHLNNTEEYEAMLDLVGNNVHNIWLERYKDDKYFKRVHSSFSNATSYLVRTDVGTGLPRALSQMVPAAQCYSPYFEHDFVPDIWYLLPACDRFLHNGGEIDELLDPFIAGYMAAHYPRNIDEDLRRIQAQINTRDNARNDYQLRQGNARLSILEAKLIAEIQDKVNNDLLLPDLCNFYVKKFNDAISLYHSRTLQRQVRKELGQVGKAGKLQELIDIISNPQRLDLDARGFESACGVYKEITDDLNQLQREIYDIDGLSQEIGGRFSVTLSSMLSLFGSTFIFFANIF